MAAIDKMYLTYYDFDSLRNWAIIYYPKLFRYMYSPFISHTEFNDGQKTKHNEHKACAIREYERFDGANGIEALYKNLCKENSDGHPTQREMEYWKEDAVDIMRKYFEVNLPDYDNSWYEEELPCTNTPLKIDKYLLWHCPLSCVQKYLNERCGYKTRWYHKLFWKGKKNF